MSLLYTISFQIILSTIFLFCIYKHLELSISTNLVLHISLGYTPYKGSNPVEIRAASEKCCASFQVKARFLIHVQCKQTLSQGLCNSERDLLKRLT